MPTAGRGRVRFSANQLSNPLQVQAENLYLTPSQVWSTPGPSVSGSVLLLILILIPCWRLAPHGNKRHEGVRHLFSPACHVAGKRANGRKKVPDPALLSATHRPLSSSPLATHLPLFRPSVVKVGTGTIAATPLFSNVKPIGLHGAGPIFTISFSL